MLTLSLLKACSDAHSGFPLFFLNGDALPRAQEQDSPRLQGKGLGLSQQRESAEMMVAFPSGNDSTSESLLNSGGCIRNHSPNNLQES